METSTRPLSAENGGIMAAAMAGQGYPAISDYALIGDGRTCALVSKDGAVEWWCLPHFAGESIFAALLDRKRGGHFTVRPQGQYVSDRCYEGETAVLRTTFRTASGELVLTDAMPIHARKRDEPFQPQRELLRRIECTEGEVTLQVAFAPRPRYGNYVPHLRRRGKLGWSCAWGAKLLHLYSDLPLDAAERSTAVCTTATLKKGDVRYLSVTFAENDVGVIAPLGDHAEDRIRRTREWWQNWSESCSYHGPYPDAVLRSVITLKLLTYTLSGAIVAAPTTSLPEHVGGKRNWDYRYCWLRDAAMTLQGLIDVGYFDEGDSFLGWLLNATRLTAPKLQVLYDVYGEVHIPEKKLKQLEGYQRSKPVHLGNGAWSQRQLDVYGEVVLAAFDYVQRGGRMDRYERKILVGIGNQVLREWHLPDKGLWESRGPDRHHTHSKVICWVALDRLVKLHEQGHLQIPVDRYRKAMAAIRETVEREAWSERLGAYTGVFGDDRLDAAVLLFHRYGYAPGDDPRMRSTLEAIDRELTRGPHVYRYNRFDDDMPPGEGTFGACSFWAVDALVWQGRLREAEQRFEQLLETANDVGLYSEEYDPATGAALGNFPQAFTHVGLIIAALAIAKAHEQRGKQRT